MIKYIKGDLFKGGQEIIIHGCNCFNTMGGGVAYYVSKYYPEAYEIDCKTLKGDKNKLGTYTTWKGLNLFYPERNITIINAYTQFTMSSQRLVADYDALKDVLRKINLNFPTQSLSMPKICCGLAGGDWNVVEKIIEEVFGEREIFVYILG